jgi:hypothetical protein
MRVFTALVYDAGGPRRRYDEGVRRARFLFVWLAMCAALFGAEIKLYLKEGGFHLVREYKVESDRVRYFSTERGDWEEVPLDLVDLKKTERELKSKTDAEQKAAALDDAEEKFERAQAEEAAKVPQEVGAYFVQGDKVLPIKQADVKVQTDKKRSVLKAITPIPIVTGKASVEVDGERSAVVVAGDRPTLYFRRGQSERFGIVKMAPKKGVRVVERWEIAPVVNLVQATREEVEIFRQELHPGLFKIWPQKPMSPGEYAVIDFNEGEGNTQVWDFRLERAPQ